MRILCVGAISLVAAALPGLGQEGVQHGSLANVEIRLDQHAAGFWGRYVVTDGITSRVGSITPAASASIEHIPVSPDVHVRAILYSEGCALKTLDIGVTESRSYEYDFGCDAIPETQVRGTVARLDRMYGHSTSLEATYVADWASEFFGLEEGTSTEIPLGAVASPDQENRFVLPIPDLSRDKLANAADHPGEIRIWARNKSGRIVAQLRLSQEESNIVPSRLGGLPILPLNFSDLVFVPCTANAPAGHDPYGFAMRPAPKEACGH